MQEVSRHCDLFVVVCVLSNSDFIYACVGVSKLLERYLVDHVGSALVLNSCFSRIMLGSCGVLAAVEEIDVCWSIGILENIVHCFVIRVFRCSGK